MVANITTGKDLGGALYYNQQKVDEGQGKVLSTHLIPEPEDGLFNVKQTTSFMLDWMPQRFRCEKPVIHISLNPDIKDNLTDEQLSEIADKYMDRMGYGSQPYMVFKHTDIEREHIHIVSLQVDSEGRKIKDKLRNTRSVAITEELEKEYHLHPAKGQKRTELWQLKPINPAEGDLRKQMVSVLKPAIALYRFQTLGELRALLSLYNIGIEEVIGERKGVPYHGLLYTALDDGGQKACVTPLKSSLIGKDYGFDSLTRRMERNRIKIEKDKIRDHTRHGVKEAMLDAPTEGELRERLKTYNIELFMRRNGAGRIVGVTFIDHEKRCILNGSRLGKEYSANVFNLYFGKKSLANEKSVKQNMLKDNHSAQLILNSTSGNNNKSSVQNKKKRSQI